jgi:hypothetical protein
MHATRWLFMACMALLFLLESPGIVNAGFGITPPYVRSDRLTQGSTFTQEIILVRGSPTQDLKAEITLNVPGIEDWITIDRGSEFLLPAGERQVPIRITVRVPSDAPYERHQGSIRIRTMSPDPASGVSIALGAQIDVDLRVVDEIRDFEIRRVRISEAEEPRRMWWLEYPGRITFTMGVENTGNAPTAPSRIQLDIYDRRGNVVLETTYNTNALEAVLPFETREVIAYLPTRLPPGAYLVRYSIFRFESEVKRSGELTLSILPQGTLAAYAGYGFEGLALSDLLTIAIPLTILLTLVLSGAFVAHLRRKNKKRRRVTRSDQGRYPDDYPGAPPQQRPMSRPPPRHIHSNGGVVDLSGRRRGR